jgi:DNA-binding response OmpR family regulator
MKKIVIVDDEENIIGVLEKYLKRKAKVEIDSFTNAKEALPKILSGNYDLVLLDIMMPEINGLDMLENIKKSRPDQKVLMMTAYSTEEKIIKSDLVGANDYITKPFISLRDVENKIYDHLDI